MKAETLGALGEPSRLRIVELLRSGSFSVGEIADTLSIRQPQVSKHLRVLTESGFVSAAPVARRRIYHLEAGPFEEIGNRVDSFISTSSSSTWPSDPEPGPSVEVTR